MTSKAERLQHLRDLTGQPQARAAYAATLLKASYGLEVIRSALDVLIEHPHAGARTELTALYDHYAANGVQRDAATYTRSAIIRALRPVAIYEDRDLMEHALQTYEYPPPAYEEEASLLRSNALVALSDVDDELAKFHATRLLADARTDPMSGEPALTAVAVLAAQHELLPLYFYATQRAEAIHPEVVAESLRRLADLPAAALRPLLTTHADTEEPGVVVGLVDMLSQTLDEDLGRDFLTDLLRRVKDVDMYRYVVATLLAANLPGRRQVAIDHAQQESDPDRCCVLIDLLPPVGELVDLVRTLQKRASAGSRGRTPGRRTGRTG